MKKIKFKFRKCILTTLLLSLFVVSVVAQPTVTRITGSGQCMALSGEYQFTYSGTVDDHYWSVAGDLEIVGSTTGDIVTVRSFNKNTAYNIDGYGKGRVYLHYNKEYCGWNRVYYDVYKSFTPIDPIIGPECVIEGDTVVFSYKPILTVNINDQIGTDSYKWNLDELNGETIVYFSGDSSAVTFKVGQLDGTDTIAVTVGRCNSDTVKLGLNKKAPMPEIAADTCITADATSLTLSLINPVTDGSVVYTWELPSQFSSNTLTGTTINITMGENKTGIVRVTASLASVDSDCSTSEASINVNRKFSSSAAILGSTCAKVGTQYGYSITGNAPDNSTFKWEEPKGWTKVGSGQTIYLTPTADALSDTLRVTLSSCNDTTLILPISVKPDTVSPIYGDSCVTAGVTYKYYVDTTGVKPRAENYTWTVPAGWDTPVYGVSHDTVYVTPRGTNIGNITVTPIGKAGCNGATTTFAVQFNPEKPDAILNMDSTSCINSGLSDTITLKIKTPIANQTYGWVLPTTWSIVSANAYYSEIEVKTDTIKDSTFVVKAFGEGICENSDTIQKSITITGDASFVITYSGDGIYRVPTYSGATYKWFLVHNNVDISSTGIFSVGYRGMLIDDSLGDLSDSTSYTLVADVIKSDGCRFRTTIGAPLSIELGNQLRSARIDENAQAITLSPNPTYSDITLDFPVKDTYTVTIFDLNGKQYDSQKVTGISGTINVNSFPRGTYIALIQTTKYRTFKKFIKK